MGEYYVGKKYRKMLSLLKKCDGLVIKPGSRHTKITGPSGAITTLPRHTDISNGVVEEICEFLISEHYSKELIDKYIK